MLSAISPEIDPSVHGAHGKASELGISSLPQGQVRRVRLIGEMTRKANVMVQTLELISCNLLSDGR